MDRMTGILSAVVTRVRSTLGSIVLASVAAALAWFIANRVLGHADPFFAPIAAAVSLSTSQIQRFRRSLQLVGGVLLGIGLGELLSSALGTSTVAVGLVVFVTLVFAVAAGAGFFAGGMMFANQAAASAILVVTLHKHGTGAERALDALVGGGVAIVLGTGLFPADPLKLLRDAERHLLRALATTLEEAAEMLSNSTDPGPEWLIARGSEVHRCLAGLESARTTARANVRIAPRRWRLRPIVAAELARLRRFDALADAVLGTARAALRPFEGSGPLPITLRDDLAAVGDGLRRLASERQPWPKAVLDEVRAVIARIVARSAAEPVDRAAVVGPLLHTSALDLASVVGLEQPIG